MEERSKTKKIIIVGGIIIAFVVFFLLFIIGRREQTAPSPTPAARGVDYKGLVPGVSIKDDVIGTLGEPVDERESGERTIASFESTSPTRNHEAFFTENTLSVLKRIVSVNDDLTAQELISEYGETQHILYGPGATSGFNLYVYPDKGIAFIGNIEGDIVLEVWYFQPTTFENFKEVYAPNYSESFAPQQ